MNCRILNFFLFTILSGMWKWKCLKVTGISSPCFMSGSLGNHSCEFVSLEPQVKKSSLAITIFASHGRTEDLIDWKQVYLATFERQK